MKNVFENEYEDVGQKMKDTIKLMMIAAHETAVDKGWWEDEAGDRPFSDQLINMMAELSEVWESYRENGLEKDFFLFGEVADGDGGTFHDVSSLEEMSFVKPEGIAVEFADVLIRIFDTCQRYEIPLAEALSLKMRYNKTRPYRHGGKKA